MFEKNKAPTFDNLFAEASFFKSHTGYVDTGKRKHIPDGMDISFLEKNKRLKNYSHSPLKRIHLYEEMPLDLGYLQEKP